ncbi:MAG: hypothetical protein AB7K86_06150 [Rhodospirillales bacterium]
MRDRPKSDYSGEKARQGEIILRTRGRRTVFIAGLVGVFVAVVLLAVLAG